jgi:hypothetical protein
VLSYFQEHLLLYTENAFNGILFMNSKSHLQVQELLLDKQKAAGSNDYVDYGIRMACI